MGNTAGSGHRFSITRRQITLSAGLAVAMLALIVAVDMAFGWSYNHDTRWMVPGLFFFSGAIPACGFAAVGVLFGQGVRAALCGVVVGVALTLIVVTTML